MAASSPKRRARTSGSRSGAACCTTSTRTAPRSSATATTPSRLGRRGLRSGGNSFGVPNAGWPTTNSCPTSTLTGASRSASVSILSGYAATDIRTLKTRDLLASPALGDAIMASFCEGGGSRNIVRSILSRLKGLEQHALNRAYGTLVTLASLRKVNEIDET